MSETSSECADCGCSIRRAGPRGPQPTRCKTCAGRRQSLQSAAWDARRSAQYADQPHECLRCGRSVDRRVKNGPWPKYCPPCKKLRRRQQNQAHYDKHSAAYEAQLHKCVDCGKQVRRERRVGQLPKRCAVCLPTWRRKYNAEYNAAIRDLSRICCDCEQAFSVGEHSENWSKRCRPCDVRAKQDQRHDKNDRRHAREVNAESVSFSAVAVFERDGWICQLCRREVDFQLRWPDPEMATIDHVRPLSRGGAHVESNAQLAHLRCNLAKGARWDQNNESA